MFRQYAGTEVLAILRSIGSPTELIRVYPGNSSEAVDDHSGPRSLK